jgi:hypothetical protein
LVGARDEFGMRDVDFTCVISSCFAFPSAFCLTVPLSYPYYRCLPSGAQSFFFLLTLLSGASQQALPRGMELRIDAVDATLMPDLPTLTFVP